MDNSAISSHQFNPGNGLSDRAMDHAAVPMQGTVNNALVSNSGDSRAAIPVVTRVAEMAHQTVDKVAEAATPTVAWLSAQGESLAASKRNADAGARVYVSANPWRALGVAVAAGFLLGRLTR